MIDQPSLANTENNCHIEGLNQNKPSIMKGITKPGIENYSKLMSSENYVVPRFQRDYSWKEANWFELWQDVNSILDGSVEERYMGYLVLLQKGRSNEIIDGQQRLITISLMILAFIKNIKNISDDDEAKRKIQLLKTRYIAEEGIQKGVFTHKLRLNENNHDLYISFVSDIPLSRTKRNPSENLMFKCLNWFTNKIPDLGYDNIEKMANAVQAISDSLFFTTLYVSDDLNAYVVFETLNARGVKLSSSDLLKNYLFQKINPLGEDILNEVEGKWRKIVTVIGSEDLVDFIRYYWNSRNKIVRKVDLYRDIKNDNNTPEKVVTLLNDLLNSAYIYAALNNPNDDYWNGNEKISEKLRTIKIFKLKQPLVPLLIGKEVLDIKQFEKLLNYCVSFSFRYNIICDLSPNEQEFFYNELAQSINTKKTISETDFKKLYPSDEIFMSHFNKKEFIYNTPNSKLIKYILASIERTLSNEKALSLFSQDLTIEHILPQSPSTEWKIKPDDHKKLVNKLGNLTLLNKQEQKKADNLIFDKKIPVYKKSSYEITKSIVTSSKNGWDEEMIMQRQHSLYLKAKTIWSIPGIN